MGNRKAPIPPPPPPKGFSGGWGTATLSVWIQRPGAELEDPAEMADSLTGWLELVGKDEVGVDLAGGGHARWVLVVRSVRGGAIVAGIPGCKVQAITFHDRPRSDSQWFPFERDENLNLVRAQALEEGDEDDGEDTHGATRQGDGGAGPSAPPDGGGARGSGDEGLPGQDRADVDRSRDRGGVTGTVPEGDGEAALRWMLEHEGCADVNERFGHYKTAAQFLESLKAQCYHDGWQAALIRDREAGEGAAE